MRETASQPLSLKVSYGLFPTLLLVLFVFVLGPVNRGFANAIAAGDEYSLVLVTDGVAWGWGANADGQLGLGHDETQAHPQRLVGHSFASVAAGDEHTLAIGLDGTLFAWGNNSIGQLGLGDFATRNVPTQVGVDVDWEVVSAGAHHTLAIKGGKLYAWGSNSAGQLGTGDYSAVSAPVLIGGTEDWIAVSAGEIHSLAVRADGTLWAWGSNLEGQLGLPEAVVTVPTQIGTDTDWADVSAGDWHSLALKADDSLWSWGRNLHGQTGLGAGIDDQNTPARVGLDNDWTSISAGGNHSAALKADGTLWMWGANGNGQLGDGTNAQRWRPVQIEVSGEAGVAWTAVAAGGAHTVAVNADGEVFASGLNSSGQLGNGTIQDGGQVNGFGSTLLGKPDLEITAVSLPNPNPPVDVDAPFTITVEGINAGSGPIVSGDIFSIALRLTSDASWGSAGDVVLGSFEVTDALFAGGTDGFGVGETFSVDLSVTLAQPLAAGDYFVAAMLDDGADINESEEGNNRAWTAVAVPFLPNLQVTNLDETVVSVAPGDEQAFGFSVMNDGTATLAAGNLDVELSLLDSDGVEWPLSGQAITLDALLAKDSAIVSVSVTIPDYLAPGSYSLSVEADASGSVQESDEADNELLSGTAFVEVGGISLADSLNQGGLEFEKSSGISWFGRESIGFNEDGAASVPALPMGGDVWFQTEIATDSTVTFRWKAETLDPANELVLAVDGVEVASISGQTDWERVSLDALAGEVLTWTYTQGADTEGDLVFVDGLQITPQDLPDFAVIGAVYGAGNYVLERAGEHLDITATGINLGTTVAPLPAGFKMTAYLSPTPVVDPLVNIPLGDLTLFRGLDANNRFVYRADLPLPSSLAAGAYYLVVIVDSAASAAESDEDNNAFVSAAPDITIERRANLEVASLDYTGDLYLAGDEIFFEIAVRNAGLEDVPAGVPFDLSLFLSNTDVAGEGETVELVTFQESLGIAAGDTVTYEIAVPVPEEAPLGQLQHAAASVDVTGAVPESDESDNTLFSPLPNLIFGQVTVEEALDITLTGSDVFTNAADDSLPWFGQTGTASDGIDAAQSPAVLDGEEAGFELAVDVPSETVISFFWSVSSERVESEESVKEDYLAFFVDGVEQARISGEVGWEQASFVLNPGSRILAWRYIKDGSEAGGADTAWVDDVVYRLPDLQVSQAPSAPAGNLFPGGPLTIDFELTNGGTGSSPAFDVELVLSVDKDFANAQNIDLGTFVADGLAPGQTQAYSRTVELPGSLPVPGNYYIGLRADGGTLIPESMEGNNFAWSDTNGLVVTVPVTLEDAIDLAELNPALGLTVSRGGELWFGQEVEFDGTVAGNVDAGRSPSLDAGEQAWFEMTVAGPSVIEFRTKVETSHVSNHLKVSVDGAEKLSISDSEDWTAQTILLPALTNVVRWTYVQGASAPDVAYVDQVQVSELTDPDFLIQSVEYLSGEYVLTRDGLQITALGSNQGADAVLGDDFRILARLVEENTPAGFAAGIDLGELNQFADLDADNRFVYQADLSIPTITPAGNYYLALWIDSSQAEFDDATGNLNNYFFSLSPDIEVVRLPDLVVEALSYTGGSFIYGDEMQLSFTIRNDGLADLEAQEFPISVLLSPDRTLNPADDDLLLQFTEVSGLARGQSRTYNVTVEMKETIRNGEPLTLGVLVDSANEVRESLEANNARLSNLQDILVGELPLDVAVDNDEPPLFVSEIPWFGQSGESFDGEDAGRSGKADDSEMSAFEARVTNENPTIVSFYWKISSERTENPESGELKEDALVFKINGTEQARISGEVDWTRVSFPLPAGSVDLRWEYVKDATLSSGEDAAWVDVFNYQLPDLIVEDIQYVPSDPLAPALSPGDSFPFSIKVRNQGVREVTGSSAVTLEVRLSRNNIWGDGDDIFLGAAPLEGLDMLASKDIGFDGAVIPGDIPFGGLYHIGAMIDVGDVAAESSDSNNVLFSFSADIELSPAVNLAEALDDDEFPLGGAWTDSGWQTSGDKSWFGQNNRQLDDGTDSSFDLTDAARSGAIDSGEVSVLEREVNLTPAGPATISFRWKISSMTNANYLRFLISGKEVARISGDVDWTEASFLVPTGPQVLRWEYVKTGALVVGEDAGFLDRVQIVESTLSDLVITQADFRQGEYVLERDRLPLQVTVKNQGAALQNTDFVPSDLGVRLSVDKVWGNSDDLILGNFARVDEFDGGNRLVFSGDIYLPSGVNAPIPEGSYYLALLVDPFDVIENLDEYDRENNFFWSEPDAIEIRHLPDLGLEFETLPPFDTEKEYFGMTTLKLDMTVVNSGLGDILGDQSFSHDIELRARLVEDGLPGFDWIVDGVTVESLATIPESAFIPGISRELPDGHSIEYENHLMLPGEAELLSALGLTLAERDQLAEWEFALVVTLDENDDIEEWDENDNVVVVPGIFGINPLADAPTTAEDWASSYGFTFPEPPDPSDPEDPVYAARLRQYAFGLNPLLSDQKPEIPFGWITVDGDDYFRITFDVVVGATDIVYTVEQSTDNVTWSPVVEIDPNAGIDLTDPFIISAAYQGYTAAVTVRDTVSLDNVPDGEGRFLRVQVTKK